VKKEGELFALLTQKEKKVLPELVEVITCRGQNKMSPELKIWHGVFWTQFNSLVEGIADHDSWMKALIETVASRSLARITAEDMQWFRDTNKNPEHWTHHYKNWVLCNNLMVQPKPSIEKLKELKEVDILQGDFLIANTFKKTGQVISNE